MNRLRLFLTVLLLALAAPAFAQQFGGTVTVGDGEIFVGELRQQATSGTVYVFRADADGQWQEAAHLQAADADGKEDRFGRALAHDGTTLLVGATMKDGVTGAVYAFERDGDTWRQKARLQADDAAEGQGFGNTIVLQGDRALISAPRHTNRTGATYVFERGTDGQWQQTARLQVEGSGEGDTFGVGLALDGDTAFISAPGTEQGTGSIYRYQYADGSWQAMGALEVNGLSSGAGLGAALHLQEGLLLIGAPRHDDGTGAVVAFQYDADDMAWQRAGTLVPFDGSTGQFGSSLAFNGETLWVGAPRADNRVGGVYRLAYDDGQWTGAYRVMAPGLDGRDSYGSSVALGADLAVVGVTGDDYGAGSALVFAAHDGQWHAQGRLVNEVTNFAAVRGGQVRCEDGQAGAFGCEGMDMLSFVPVEEMGGTRGVSVNDLWGWADPETGREYALVGRRDGTSFVDVSDPYNPRYLGDLPKTEGSPGSVWRDIKVYKDHAFIVADGAGAHGMQIFDLTRLRNVENAPVTFDADVHYDGIFSAHNVVINEDTGYAYAVGNSSGGETCGGGLHMINVQEPKNPQFVGCFSHIETGRRGTGYSHDAQCVVYDGPDADYQGREVCFGSNETVLSIADVTDKANPVAIARAPYPNVAYSHQGWLTEDHRYFYMNDEGDEARGLVEGTRTLVWDVTDLDDPVLIHEYIAQNNAIDHNLYVRGNLMYQSNYVSGLRVLDITNPELPVEIGYFDTVPYGEDTPSTGGGSWSNYPFFESGIIIVTSGKEGLFILKKSDSEI